VEIEMMEI